MKTQKNFEIIRKYISTLYILINISTLIIYYIIRQVKFHFFHFFWSPYYQLENFVRQRASVAGTERATASSSQQRERFFWHSGSVLE